MHVGLLHVAALRCDLDLIRAHQLHQQLRHRAERVRIGHDELCLDLHTDRHLALGTHVADRADHVLKRFHARLFRFKPQRFGRFRPGGQHDRLLMLRKPLVQLLRDKRHERM